MDPNAGVQFEIRCHHRTTAPPATGMMVWVADPACESAKLRILYQ
jgi:hypothetical protein